MNIPVPRRTPSPPRPYICLCPAMWRKAVRSRCCEYPNLPPGSLYALSLPLRKTFSCCRHRQCRQMFPHKDRCCRIYYPMYNGCCRTKRMPFPVLCLQMPFLTSLQSSILLPLSPQAFRHIASGCLSADIRFRLHLRICCPRPCARQCSHSACHPKTSCRSRQLRSAYLSPVCSAADG